MRPLDKRIFSTFLALYLSSFSLAQGGHPPPVAPPAGAKSRICKGRQVPQLEDVTQKAGIQFRHVGAPEKKYIVESMSGGVILIDYDRDGWLDIYFTNAPTLEMAVKHQTAKGALYHNNRDGTFTDVTAKSGIAPCFAMGGAVGDINNDGWPDLFITCLGGNHLYKNNGDGTFTDVTAKRWSRGRTLVNRGCFWRLRWGRFCRLDGHQLRGLSPRCSPEFGKSPNCKYKGLDVQCGPRGLRGSGDSLFHNNGGGTFTDVSKLAGVADAPGYFGMGVIWSDFNNTGRPDIYVANDSTPNYLYRNDGNGKFTDISFESGAAVSKDGLEQGSMGIAIGDYAHSGRPSMYVTNFADEYSTLYRNDGKWDFQDFSFQSGVALPIPEFREMGNCFPRCR